MAPTSKTNTPPPVIGIISPSESNPVSHPLQSSIQPPSTHPTTSPSSHTKPKPTNYPHHGKPNAVSPLNSISPCAMQPSALTAPCSSLEHKQHRPFLNSLNYIVRNRNYCNVNSYISHWEFGLRKIRVGERIRLGRIIIIRRTRSFGKLVRGLLINVFCVFGDEANCS